MDLKSGSFTHYRSDSTDPQSISSNEVIEIYEDRKGTIWIGTGSVYSKNANDPGTGGLNRFDRKTGKFTRFLKQPGDSATLINNKVSAIFEDSRGTFWVGTAGDGLHTMDRQKGQFRTFAVCPPPNRKTQPAPVNQQPRLRKI